VKIEVLKISFGEIADEALQPPILHDGFGFVAIFGRSGGEPSPMFSTGERLPFPCIFHNQAYICETSCHFMLVWERDAERNLETSLWINIVRGHYALRIVGDLESEFVARRRAGKREWKENNLDIGSAWKHQKYKPGACKFNTKSLLFSSARTRPTD